MFLRQIYQSQPHPHQSLPETLVW